MLNLPITDMSQLSYSPASAATVAKPASSGFLRKNSMARTVAPRGGTTTTMNIQSQPGVVPENYTGRGVIPTVMGSNLPITDMTQLKLTPEGAAQRQVDLGAWNNMYMNSPSYNAGGANTYAIQNGPQDSLLASYYGNTAAPQNGNGSVTPTPTSNAGGTVTNTSPTRMGTSGISDSGNPIYDSGFSLQNNYQNSQVPGSEGYLSKATRTGTTRGNPYNKVFPWSNWKLWS